LGDKWIVSSSSEKDLGEKKLDVKQQGVLPAQKATTSCANSVSSFTIPFYSWEDLDGVFERH